MLFEIFSDHIILVWMNLSLNYFFVNVATFRKAEKEPPVTPPPPSYHLEFALLSQSNYNFQAYILWHFPLSFTCFYTGITFVWVRPIVWGVRF